MCVSCSRWHRKRAKQSRAEMISVMGSGSGVHIFGSDVATMPANEIFIGCLSRTHTLTHGDIHFWRCGGYAASHAILFLTIHLHKMSNWSNGHLKNCLRKCHRHWCVSLRALNCRCTSLLLFKWIDDASTARSNWIDKLCARDGNQRDTKRLNLCGETI